MKKILCIVLISIVILFVLITSKQNKNSAIDIINKNIDIDLSKCKIELDKNSHGGFLGDGDYYVKLNCSDISDYSLKKIQEWNKLPLSENLQLIMYSGEKNGKIYDYKLATKAGIPEIKNGYYLFIDRHSESVDAYSDKELFNRYSYNFTIVFYDLDTNYLYYYEFDT